MGPFWAQLQCVDCLAFGERWVGEGASLFGFYRETKTLAVKRCLKQAAGREQSRDCFVKSCRGWNNSNFIKTACQNSGL